jgi:hypothetical protein
LNERDLSTALAKATAWLDSIAGVQIVAAGKQPDGSPCIDVWVDSTAEVGAIPDRLDGFPVRVQETGGPVTAQ